MALLPTGSNKLLEINTEEVNIAIKAKKNWQGIMTDRLSSLVVEGYGLKRISLGVTGEETNFDSSAYAQYDLHVPPLFFEQTDYELVVKSNNGSSVSVWHDNYLLREKISPVIDGDTSLLSGVLNFDNSVGYTDFDIFLDGRKYLSFRIEVFPTKISYREDYQQMLEDISEMVCGVALDFMQKTYQTFSLGNKQSSLLSVYFQILSVIFRDYTQAVNRIVAVPQHKLLTEHVVMPEHKAKRTDRLSVKWLEKHPGYVEVENGNINATRVLAAKRRVTFDTVENRFVKFMLQGTLRKLDAFRKKYISTAKKAEEIILCRINDMEGSIKRILHNSFLQEVAEDSPAQSMSLVFGMAPGYRELYKCYLMLQRGLSLNGDVFKMSVKDTAQLYEYWCFLKLYSLLKQEYKLLTPDIIKVDNSGITVTLVKGAKSEVKFLNPKSGEEILLVYNPSESKTQTVNQKPDNVLELQKTGSDITYKYIFDAKYRIERNPENSFYPDSKPGPKVDDINTMHRYRDSIVYENKQSRFMFEKTMFGAYILFPYADEEQYLQHRFYKSIDTVNIGGLPFLPGATKLVQKLLSELINDSRESAFERTTLPIGIEKKLATVDWNRRDVLLGVFHTYEQFQICLTKKFYYIPASKISEDKLPIHFVALYETNKMYERAKMSEQGQIRYYGEITRMALVRRESIREVPVSRNNPDEPYYKVYVKEWKLVEDINEHKKPIKPKESGFIADFTTMFLLEHGEYVPDLLIKDEAQYRLYAELKHVAENYEVNGSGKNLSFDYLSTKLVFTDGKIQPVRGGRLLEPVLISDFLKRPGRTFSVLRQIIASE